MRGQTEVKPIETEYNGYRFRSRLEARWAVFFDEAGISYQYEPDGFEIGEGVKYLPDFYLPSYQLYIEIKPSLGNDPDKHEKIEKWEDKCRKFRSVTGNAIMIVYGDPASDTWGRLFAWFANEGGGGEYEEAARFIPLGNWEKPDIIVMVFGGERTDEEVGIMPDMTINDLVLNEAMLVKRRWEDARSLLNAPMTEMFNENAERGFDAMRKKARQARFEYGENPGKVKPFSVSIDDLIDLEHRNVKLILAFCKKVGLKLPLDSADPADWLQTALICQKEKRECSCSQIEQYGYEEVERYVHENIKGLLKEKQRTDNLCETFGST